MYVFHVIDLELQLLQRLVDLILKHTGADPGLVNYVEANEVLTTKDKFVDARKAAQHLKHESTFSLDDGVKETVKWMKEYYGL